MVRMLLVGSPHFMEWDPEYTYSGRVQDGLARLCSGLAAFAPDRILLEANRSWQGELDAAYQALSMDDFDDPVVMRSKVLGHFHADGQSFPIGFNNEGVQIGFRVAGTLGQDHVYAMDYDLLHPFDFTLYGREGEVAGRDDSRAAYDALSRREGILTAAGDIVGLFLHLNGAMAARTAHHHHYLAMNALGAGKGYEGSAFLLKWYERNLKSLANLQDHARGCERVMVLCGAGHLQLYRDFLVNCPDMGLEPLERWVGDGGGC